METAKKQDHHATLEPLLRAEGHPFEDGILGVNMEITRTGFFGGLCAQMLNNRKLFMGTDGVRLGLSEFRKSPGPSRGKPLPK